MKPDMGVFRFKKFDVVNERSAMKVNTDGVLLGAAMTVHGTDRMLLDIGTGTGTIALMAAQRLKGTEIPDRVGDDAVKQIGNDVRIDAIDIDEPSVTEAVANFSSSPWPDVFHAFNLSLDRYAAEIAGRDLSFDLIFSNPPYFDESLQAPLERRNNARHTSTGLSFREILEFSARYLTEQGRVSMVLPADLEAQLTRHARMCGLHLFRILRVRTVPRKAPSRIMAEFSRQRCDSPHEELLTIQNEGKYTQEYLSLTHDFYLFA